ncbi:MAG: hypothetical protein H7A37_10230 [Chlamydiales bacterium]|nr:hypothetical protein [Chlamydiia bacterium]MCP5508654.1 hypothetical protein [Chlamydiales bacterium]
MAVNAINDSVTDDDIYDDFLKLNVQSAPPEEIKASLRSRAVAWLTNQVYYLPVHALAFLVAATVFQIFTPILAPAFWGIGIAIITTKLVVKIAAKYNIEAIDTCERKVLELTGQYPYIQIIGFISAIALGCLFWGAGLFFGAVVGVVSGIVIEREMNKKMLELDRERSKNIEINGFQRLLKA